MEIEAEAGFEGVNTPSGLHRDAWYQRRITSDTLSYQKGYALEGLDA